ncbi:hypothetical protein [Rhizobium yanglingense]
MTSDVQWGIDTAGFYGVQEGVLTTIRLADVGATGDDARHTVPQITLGGWGGETIAFSPDGRFLASSNLRGTGKPDGSSDWTEAASISLYERDAETGRLTQSEASGRLLVYYRKVSLSTGPGACCSLA